MLISYEGEAFTRMMNRRGAMSRAHVVEFEEATEKKALEFLKTRLAELKFYEKENESVDLVQNYTGGKFKTLVDVAKEVDDLQGSCSRWLYSLI